MPLFFQPKTITYKYLNVTFYVVWLSPKPKQYKRDMLRLVTCVGNNFLSLPLFENVTHPYLAKLYQMAVMRSTMTESCGAGGGGDCAAMGFRKYPMENR